MFIIQRSGHVCDIITHLFAVDADRDVFAGWQERAVTAFEAVWTSGTIVEVTSVAGPAGVADTRVGQRVTLAVPRAVDVNTRAAVVLAQLEVDKQTIMRIM